MRRVTGEADGGPRPGPSLLICVLLMSLITIAVLLVMAAPATSANVQWEAPDPGAYVSKDVDVVVTASANVTNVTFYHRSNGPYLPIGNGTFTAPNFYSIKWVTFLLSDGKYELLANATLSGGGYELVNVSDINVDNKAPIVTFVTPTSGVRINGLYQIMVQTSLDVVAVDLFIDMGSGFTPLGSAQNHAGSINWTMNWPTPNGEMSDVGLIASARDAAENEGRTAVLGIMIDNVPPIVSFMGTENGATLDGHHLLRGNTSEEYMADAYFEWREGEGEWEGIGDARWNEALGEWRLSWNTYLVGEHADVEVRFTVVDDLGQKGHASAYDITITDSVPTPLFVAPLEGDHLTGEVELHVTSQNDTQSVHLSYHDGTDWVDIGQAVRVNGTHWNLTWDTSGLSLAETVLSATAFDARGNGTVLLTSIEVDNTSPAPQIILPSYSKYHLYDDVAILIISDRDTASIYLHYKDGEDWVTIGDAYYDNNNDRWMLIWLVPSAGLYLEGSVLRATAVDEVGLVGTDTLEHRIIGNKPHDKPPEFLDTMPETLYIDEDQVATLDLLGHVDDDDMSTLKFYVIDEPKDLFSVNGENITGLLTLTFNTLPDRYGEATITIHIVDSGGKTAQKPLDVVVRPVNDPPVFFSVPPSLHVRPGVPYAFDYTPYVEDVDSRREDLLVLKPDDEHVSKVVGNSLALEFNYAKSELDKTYFVNVTVRDPDGLIAWSSIMVKVVDDWVPEIREPLPDIEIEEDEVRINAFSLDNFFHDKDQDALYYSYGNKYVRVVIGAEFPHPVSIYPPKNWHGVDTVTFRATDPTLALVEDTIIVRCLSSNDPPVFHDEPTIPLILVHANQTYEFDLFPYVEDVDHELADLTIHTEDPYASRSSLHPLGLRLFYPYRMGTFFLILEIRDPEGASTGSRTLQIKVTNSNYPPFLDTPPGDLWILEGSSQVSAFSIKDAHDPDWLESGGNWRDLEFLFICDHVHFSVDDTGWVQLQLNDPHFNTFNGTFNNPLAVLLRVLDAQGAFCEYSFLLTVEGVNDPPQVDVIAPLKIKPTIQTIDLRNYIRDVDTPFAELEFRVEDPTDPNAIITRMSVHGLLLVLDYRGSDSRTDRLNLVVIDGDHRVETPVMVTVEASEKETSSLSTWVILLVVVATGSVAVVASRYIWGRFEPPSVSDVFLVYGDGVIIRHTSKRGAMSMDEDLAIAMLTAIQEFVQQSMRSAQLKSMQAGENNILIERDPSKLFYIAVIHTGSVTEELRKTINYTTRSIKEHFGDTLDKWDGNIAKFDGVERYLDKIMAISHATIPEGVRFEMEGVTSIETGKTYMFQGKDATRTHNIFRVLVEDQGSGLLISRIHPQRLHPSVPDAGAECIWLSKTPTKRGVSPSNTTMILHEVITHVKEHDRTVVCLDGLEYLLVHNPLDEVVSFVNELVDMVQVDDFIMMIHVDPYALDDVTLAKLSRNMVPVSDRTSSNGK